MQNLVLTFESDNKLIIKNFVNFEKEHIFEKSIFHMSLLPFCEMIIETFREIWKSQGPKELENVYINYINKINF